MLGVFKIWTASPSGGLLVHLWIVFDTDAIFKLLPSSLYLTTPPVCFKYPINIPQMFTEVQTATPISSRPNINVEDHP